jgi:hypothetical protein
VPAAAAALATLAAGRGALSTVTNFTPAGCRRRVGSSEKGRVNAYIGKGKRMGRKPGGASRGVAVGRAMLRVEVIVALCATFMAVVTAVVPDWIETVFGVDPDAHSGVLEWGLTIAFAAVALGGWLAARRTWRTLATPRAER